MSYDRIVLSINGEDMPTPAYNGYSTRKEELVKAQRVIGSSLGIMDQAEVLANGYSPGYLIKRHIAWKYTIDVSWVGLSYEEKNKVMQYTGTRYDETNQVDRGLTVEFLDMDTDTFITRMMYRGNDQTISGYGPLDASNRFKYYDIKMSLIEM